ncbi:MAG: type II toxin-antitoxin system RelE/ParE family toxin [Wenzhouxiangella sp.]|nr:MAG: type II toxin-antitoxin system RelE/ParE family toxin [Wenzhouxiangella sp.]
MLFHRAARKEWDKLPPDIRTRFKSKLAKLLDRSESPTPANRLSGAGPDVYKIKLRQAGYRLAFRLDRGELVILVIAVGRRERDSVYRALRKRIKDS